MQKSNTKIAVVGGGVAGIVAAYILSRKFQVTLIEAADYIGGHTNTITIPEGPDAGTPVDTGFIVLNDQNYPTFRKFLAQLQIPTRKSEMSFSFYCRQSGLGYSSKFPNGLFAQRRNLFRPAFLGMVRDIWRFNKEAIQDLKSGHLNGQTLGQYLIKNNYSETYIQHHLIPCAAAIWSSPPSKTMEFPAEAFVRFFYHHGLLLITGRPQWYTIVGGSHSYVRAFLERFPGEVCLNSPVETIQRNPEGVKVIITDGRVMEFDKVVLATHADQTLRLLADPSAEEKRLLSPWSYHQNHTVLHTDASIMARNRRIWASWNYIRNQNGGTEMPVSVSYYMNRLQGLTTHYQYFVSLNELAPIADRSIIKTIQYTHPNYTFETLATQEALPSLNGERNTYFCGSYFGYGFHEDAVKSGVAVAEAMGLEL